VAALLNSCGLSGHYFYNNVDTVLRRVHNAVVSGSTSIAGIVGSDFGTHNEAQPDACPAGGSATPSHLRDGGNVTMDENIIISAYPNPFNENASIEFQFASDQSSVTVDIYNIDGVKVATLFN